MEIVAHEKQSPFASEPIWRLIVRFAVPSVIALLVNSLYNIVDQIFIGNGVGYMGNGTTNIVFPITIIALALAMMIGNGGAAFLSLKLGEGNVDSAKQGIGNAVTMSVVVSIILTAVFLIFINPILTLFGATDTLRPYALEYGWIIGIGLPFMMISGAVNSMIRADGSPKYAMFSMVIGAVLNVILDAVFIFPLQMGVRGAAIATVIGQFASFLVSVVYMKRFKTIKLSRSDFRLNAKVCGNIIVFGLSSFITQFAITIVMALTNNLLAEYGAQSVYGSDIPLTATGIVMKVNQILISILFGIATGTQPIIGFNYGAKKLSPREKGAGNFAGRIGNHLGFGVPAVPARADVRHITVWLRGRSVQRICGQSLPNLFAALPADRPSDGHCRISPGGRQAGHVRASFSCPPNHIFCAGSAAASTCPWRGGRSVDRSGGRRSCLCDVAGAAAV